MSTTPRTDKLDRDLFMIGSPEVGTPYDEMEKHACTLERELQVRLGEINMLRAEINLLMEKPKLFREKWCNQCGRVVMQMREDKT